MFPRIVRTVPVAALTLCLLIPSLGSAQVPGVPQAYPPLSAKGEAILIGSTIGAAAIGVGIFYLAKGGHENHLKGCVLDGMRLQELSGKAQIYSLQGDFSPVRVDELVLLSGYRGPRVKRGEVRFFKVTGVKERYGACPVAATNSH